jgi:hypothetical protein
MNTFCTTVKFSLLNSYNFMAHEKSTTRTKMLHVQNIQKTDYVKEMKEES